MAQSCYGITEMPDPEVGWLCQVCEDTGGVMSKRPRCKLCPVEGGAMKQTTCGEWYEQLTFLLSGRQLFI
jgi:NuA3 HAT complex component NTO1